MRKLVLTFVAVSLVGTALPGTASGKAPTVRTVEAPYATPFIGHPEATGACADGDKGCVYFDVGRERLLDVEVVDGTGTPAYAYVLQRQDDGTPPKAVGHVCGATTEPLKIKPNLEVIVILSVVTGPQVPCTGVATSGRVVARFTR
jgi:hypothetical protein